MSDSRLHLNSEFYPPKPDTCDECGGELTLVDSNGETDVGKFDETYQCDDCDKTGTVEGTAEAFPNTWTRTGVVPE
jgi:hypothetical protein